MVQGKFHRIQITNNDRTSYYKLNKLQEVLLVLSNFKAFLVIDEFREIILL